MSSSPGGSPQVLWAALSCRCPCEYSSPRVVLDFWGNICLGCECHTYYKITLMGLVVHVYNSGVGGSEFKASLGYKGGPCLQKARQNN